MKTMYLIGGTMGVDKTTISRQLKKGQGVKDKGWKTRGEKLQYVLLDNEFITIKTG